MYINVDITGLNKESWAVDYGGGLNMLQALEIVSKQNGLKSNGANPRKSQFVLLSAFCCGKPVLQFQFAKLKLEESIRKTSESFEDITHSIVRPTAYFKSLDGQIESAKKGIHNLFYIAVRSEKKSNNHTINSSVGHDNDDDFLFR